MNKLQYKYSLDFLSSFNKFSLFTKIKNKFSFLHSFLLLSHKFSSSMFFIKISFILYLHIHNKRFFYIFWQLLEFD